MKIEKVEIHGLELAQAMDFQNDETKKAASKSIIVWAELTLPKEIWLEWQAICPQSTIEIENNSYGTGLEAENFEPEWTPVNEEILKILNLLIRQMRKTTVLKQKERLLLKINTLLPGSFLERKRVVLSYEALHEIYAAKKSVDQVIWYRLCSWMEELPLSGLIIRPTLSDQLSKAGERIAQLEQELEKLQMRYDALHKNYTNLLLVKQQLEYEMYA